MDATSAALILDKVLATLRAAFAGGEVAVIDGQPLKNEMTEDMVVIGFSPDRIAMEITQAVTDVDGSVRDETLSIVCLASSWRGESDSATGVRPVRLRTVEILTDVRDALAADRDLGGLVDRAELGMELGFDQAQTADGASATVEFTIEAVTL